MHDRDVCIGVLLNYQCSLSHYRVKEWRKSASIRTRPPFTYQINNFTARSEPRFTHVPLRNSRSMMTSAIVTARIVTKKIFFSKRAHYLTFQPSSNTWDKPLWNTFLIRCNDLRQNLEIPVAAKIRGSIVLITRQ